MSTYYVDPAATGANDGSSWANAWTSLQSAADTAVAGDTVYCRGTQTLSAAIDFDTNSGTSANPIKFIGCNASGVVDGTQFVVNGNSAVASCLVGGVDFVWLENFKVVDGTSRGLSYSTYCNWWVLNNVWFHSHGGYGIYAAGYIRNTRLLRCRFSSNTTGGIYRINAPQLTDCRFDNNGSYGENNSLYPKYMTDCVFDDTGEAVYCGGKDHVFRNCVFDGNTTGLRDGNSYSIVSGCRFTNNTTGIDQAMGMAFPIACYFGGNTTDISGDYSVAPIDGSTSHVIFNGSDTDHGYVDSAAGDFNLAEGASLRSVEVALP